MSARHRTPAAGPLVASDGSPLDPSLALFSQHFDFGSFCNENMFFHPVFCINYLELGILWLFYKVCLKISGIKVDNHF